MDDCFQVWVIKLIMDDHCQVWVYDIISGWVFSGVSLWSYLWTIVSGCEFMKLFMDDCFQCRCESSPDPVFRASVPCTLQSPEGSESLFANFDWIAVFLLCMCCSSSYVYVVNLCFLFSLTYLLFFLFVVFPLAICCSSSYVFVVFPLMYLLFFLLCLCCFSSYVFVVFPLVYLLFFLLCICGFSSCVFVVFPLMSVLFFLLCSCCFSSYVCVVFPLV